MATGEPEHWQKADAAFQIAHQLLEELRARSIDPQRIALIGQLGTAVDAYQAKAAKLKDFKAKNVALDTPEGKTVTADATTTAAEVDRIGNQLADAYTKAADGANASATGEIASAINITIVVSIVSVLLGVVLAIVMARSIASPIKAMTSAMGRLARREMATEIAGLGRKDEVGAMAEAVQVFKDNIIKAAQLTAEQERMKTTAAAAQKAALNKMADTFEANVGQLVGLLDASSTEMEATAKSMVGHGRPNQSAVRNGRGGGRGSRHRNSDRGVGGRGTVCVDHRDQPASGAVRESDRQSGRPTRSAPTGSCTPWRTAPRKSATW